MQAKIQIQIQAVLGFVFEFLAFTLAAKVTGIYKPHPHCPRT